MGDAKFNITSGEQLCKIISREIIDKNDWAKTFGLGTGKWQEKNSEKYPSNTFRNIVESKTRPVKYCIGTKCKTCDGIGHYRKYKKDGTYVNLTKCKDCNGEGVFLTETDR